MLNTKQIKPPTYISVFHPQNNVQIYFELSASTKSKLAAFVVLDEDFDEGFRW